MYNYCHGSLAARSVIIIAKDSLIDMKTLLVAVSVIIWSSSASTDPVCLSPPEVEHAKPNVKKDEYGIGSEVSYSCDFGYVSDGVIGTSRCELIENEQRAEWTDVKLVCVQRSCDDPGFVLNAHRKGHLFTFSHKVEYECEEGYKMVGQGTRYCQTNGQWSGTMPSCQRIYCSRPEDPEHGKIVHSSLEYGTELNYKCNAGYITSSKEPRICQADGTWSGEPHTCIEGKCRPPKAPDHGSVEVLGKELKIGSIAIYSCNAGNTLIGSEKSKCLDTGDWTFEAPKCLEPCNIPEVPHGKIGRYVRVPRQKYLQFKEIKVKTLLKDGEKLFLICQPGYEPLGSTDWQRVVLCNGGNWLEMPRCEPAKCRVTPPGSHDAMVVSMNRTHGGRVVYACREDFEETKPGSVVCHLGEWKGSVPICKDTRCYPQNLNFVGLVKETRVFFRNGESFVPRCSKGFEKPPVENTSLTCKNGQWFGHMPPCIAAPCLSPPPLPSNGHIPIAKDSYLHSSTPIYQCNEFFLEKVASTVQCLQGDWVGKPPICADSRCYTQNLKHKVGVDVVNSPGSLSRERLMVHCMEGYSAVKNLPMCLNGKWQGDERSPCYENPCAVVGIDYGALTQQKVIKKRKFFRTETQLIFTEIEIGTFPPRDLPVYLICDRGYSMAGKGANNVLLTCSRGKWVPPPICLQKESTIEHNSKLAPDIPVAEVPISMPSTSTDISTQNSADGSDESGEESVAVAAKKHSLNEDNCHCKYPVNDESIIAFAEDQPLQFESLVNKGTTVYFRCQKFGYSRLTGKATLKCDNCSQWHSSEVPYCVDPVQGDAVITFSKNVEIMPTGLLRVLKGETVTLICSSIAVEIYPKWTVPADAKVHISRKNYNEEEGQLIYSSVLEIMNASFSHEGTYACAVGTFRPTVITLEITEFECENMEEDEHLRIYYTSGLVVNSIATFHCLSPGTRVGAAKAICLPDGKWSDPKPYCNLPACDLEDLKKVVPPHSFLELGVSGNETIPFGTSLQISCEDGFVMIGNPETRCGKNKAWELGEIQCRQGCAPIKRASSSSELIVEPEKDNYYVGDHVIFFCPTGLELNSNVEVMMCLDSGWSESKVPECDTIE